MSYTANPRAPKDGQEIQEGTGMVTSDSLAAESLDQGGSFAQGQGAVASSQPSYSTTTNNTDTSGANTLPAARDAEARYDGADTQAQYQTPADEARSGMNSGGDATYDTSKGGPQTSYTGEAGGNYGLTDGQAKVKGSNITEGGFSSDNPNSSFRQDIGSKNDPSRAAERDMQAGNAKAPAYAGFEGGNSQNFQGGQGGFENLDSSEQA